MKISDFIFQYPTFNIHDGICRIRTFVDKGNKIFVLLTDLGTQNTSASVTNSVENICNSLIRKGIVPKTSIFIEHYEPIDFQNDAFDLINFNNHGEPSWSHLNYTDVIELLKCDNSEFITSTNKDKRLINEIEKMRNRIDPFVDFPLRERPDIINRRADIESRKISKKTIIDIIEKGPIEQDLTRALKSDLSIFAEIYAHIDEEYICFSEFPIADGFVDFVVFSGRSRMDVTLVEVKGANFFLVNQSNYKKFASKIEEAADQLRNRLGFIYRNYEEFRENVHEIRRKVESGKPMYNSLIGPRGNLLVDPRKDINLYCVLIGGRTKDDLYESKKRQDYENHFSPSIKIESWDTWLRKLRRD